MSAAAGERRSFPRAIFPCKIIVNTSGRKLVSHTENISKGGIKVILEERLAHSSLVGLELILRKDKPIYCEGKVMWVRENINPVAKTPTMYNTGIMFISISEADREYIKSVVDRLLSGQKKREQKAGG